MKARILGPEEWRKVEEQSGMPSLVPYAAPENVALVAVEDDAGTVVACLTVLQVTHLEGAWVDPKYRGNAGVARALLRLASALAVGRGEDWVFAGSADKRMDGICERLGGVKVPMSLSAIWVGEERCHRQSQ